MVGGWVQIKLELANSSGPKHSLETKDFNLSKEKCPKRESQRNGRVVRDETKGECEKIGICKVPKKYCSPTSERT